MNISGVSGYSSSIQMGGASRPAGPGSSAGAAPDAAEPGAGAARGDGVGASTADARDPAERTRSAGSVEEPGVARQPGRTAAANGRADMNTAELVQIRELQQRDRTVRQHEMAHLAASGGLAISGATYSFQRGPDGVAYAIGGEVRIDVSPGRTPQETIARAATIIAAALAPADPSPQDRAVAAQARQMAQQARQEAAQQQSEQMREVLAGQRERELAGIARYREIAGESADAPAAAPGAAIDVIA